MYTMWESKLKKKYLNSPRVYKSLCASLQKVFQEPDFFSVYLADFAARVKRDSVA